MAIPEQVNRAYVRKRAGQEWSLNDRPLEDQMLIDSIEEDFHTSISVEEAEQLFVKHIGDSNRTELEQEFVRRLKSISIEKL